MTRHADIRRWTRLNRLTLAVAWTADESGLYSTASNRELASASGLSPSTIGFHLALLEEAGSIVVVQRGPYAIRRRVIVDRAHPAAGFARHYLGYLKYPRVWGLDRLPTNIMGEAVGAMILDVANERVRCRIRSAV